MNPVAYDTDAFLQARVMPVFQFPDGGGATDTATWWRRMAPTPYATWHVLMDDYNGPAVVDDFGNLVCTGWRL